MKSVRKPRSRHIFGSIAVGAVLEIVVFFSIMPKDSTQPPTPLQEMLGYTQIPGGLTLSLLFGTGLGHQLDKLPEPLGTTIAIIGFAAVFALQSAAMGMPIWLALQAWSALRTRCRHPDARSDG